MTTFKMSMIALAAATALSGQAHAQARDGWYVSGAVTASRLNKADQTVANAPAPGMTLELENASEWGWGGMVAIGRSMGAMRVEAEVGHTENDSDSYTVTSPFSITLPQEGQNDVTRYMINAYFDFGQSRLRPHLGAGIGAADAQVVTVAAPARAPNAPPVKLIDDGDTDVAYQLMAGAALAISSRASVTAQYRWFDAGTVKGEDARGERFTREIAGHNFDIGLRFIF